MSAAPACPAALLQQALDMYRQPLRYRRQWADLGQPLPEGVGALLDLALAPPQALDEPARRLHASREELSSAIQFFIHQVLLAEDADPHRVLGLGPAATQGQIKAHYRKMMRLYHPDRGVGGEWSGVYASKINRAYGLLRAPQARPPGPPAALPAAGRAAAHPKPGRAAGGRRPRPALAASAAAAAAGFGFIAWNLLTLPEPTRWPAATAATAGPPPGGGWLSERELQEQVLGQLVEAYRQGDSDALARLFSERAVSSRQADREGIRREHATLFANTTQRELRLGNFRWQIDDQTAIGKGTYSLKLSSTKEKNAQPDREGILILDVERESGAPLIKGFFQSPPEKP